MPRQLVSSEVPVDLSIVEFNLDEGEEIFLSYTWERVNGPHIIRTGKGPPYMDRIGKPGQITTHPFGLRLGTWLIQEDLRQEELKAAKDELEKAQSSGAPIEDIQVLEDTIKQLDLKDLEEAKEKLKEKRNSSAPPDEIKTLEEEIEELKSQKVKAHDTVFKERYPGYKIIGQVGCGDLTMNEWNVAYLNNEMTPDPSKPVLVHLYQEPLQYRTYSCLVKWKPPDSGVTRLTIEEVKFLPETSITNYNQMVRVESGDEWLERGDVIDFAVSNQQVLRNGEVVPIVHYCHQFSDVRATIHMLNLNPTDELYQGEPIKDGGYRPRWFFGKNQYSDIWIGEDKFIDDKEGNLLRAALNGPVLLPNSAGASEEQIRGAMCLKGYREIKSPLKPLEPGEWRFVWLTPQELYVNIYFEKNTYAWNMLGLSQDNRRIYSLVCKGIPGEKGYTIEDAAELLRGVGAWNALLIDEGGDTFQKLIKDDGKLKDNISRSRQRLRATFIFAKQFTGNL